MVWAITVVADNVLLVRSQHITSPFNVSHDMFTEVTENGLKHVFNMALEI